MQEPVEDISYSNLSIPPLPSPLKSYGYLLLQNVFSPSLKVSKVSIFPTLCNSSPLRLKATLSCAPYKVKKEVISNIQWYRVDIPILKWGSTRIIRKDQTTAKLKLKQLNPIVLCPVVFGAHGGM
jgi:hypothetical protein